MSHYDIWKNNPVYQGHPDQWFGPSSYSTCGEDLFITQLFWHMGIKKPTYLDIGAHHPFTLSNTALLYSRGSRGINVEANPKLIEEFKTHRPEDKNINIGIGLEVGFKPFYMWDDLSGRNTFSKEASFKMEVLSKTIDLPIMPLDLFMLEHCPETPDFLTMDIEGLDYDVLRTSYLDFKIICVEAALEDNQKFVSMMKNKGYRVVTRISLNLIFIRSDLWDLAQLP